MELGARFVARTLKPSVIHVALDPPKRGSFKVARQHRDTCSGSSAYAWVLETDFPRMCGSVLADPQTASKEVQVIATCLVSELSSRAPGDDDVNVRR